MSDNRPVISNQEFAKMPGGSRELVSGKAGKRGGYYVSRDPRLPVEKGGSPEATSNSSFDTKAVTAHREDVKNMASKIVPTGFGTTRPATPKESANVHQGIWNDPESNKTYMDVSDRIPSLSTALKRGIAQKQLAIWAGSKGTELVTHHMDEKGNKTVNPAAAMVAESYGKKEQEWNDRRKMSKNAKAADLTRISEALKGMKK